MTINPCPFCGVIPDGAHHSFNVCQTAQWACVWCFRCGARGPIVGTGDGHVGKWQKCAIEAWNGISYD